MALITSATAAAGPDPAAGWRSWDAVAGRWEAAEPSELSVLPRTATPPPPPNATDTTAVPVRSTTLRVVVQLRPANASAAANNGSGGGSSRPGGVFDAGELGRQEVVARRTLKNTLAHPEFIPVIF